MTSKNVQQQQGHDEEPPIKYDLLREVGKGMFGSVYLANLNVSQSKRIYGIAGFLDSRKKNTAANADTEPIQVAVKRSKKLPRTAPQTNKTGFLTDQQITLEIEAMKRLSGHPNICHYLDAVEYRDVVDFLVEYVDAVALSEICPQKKKSNPYPSAQEKAKRVAGSNNTPSPARGRRTSGYDASLVACPFTSSPFNGQTPQKAAMFKGHDEHEKLNRAAERLPDDMPHTYLATENDVRHYFRQIVESVKHCHKNALAHRDLKPENILLVKNAEFYKEEKLRKAQKEAADDNNHPAIPHSRKSARWDSDESSSGSQVFSLPFTPLGTSPGSQKELLHHPFLWSEVEEQQRARRMDVKLIDFGMSFLWNPEVPEPPHFEFVGTPYFLAPEIIAHQSTGELYHTTECDVWALGVIFHILLTRGYKPFVGENMKELAKRIVKGERVDCAEDFAYWDVSDAAIDLLDKMLCVKRCDRVDIDAVLNHPWMNMESNNTAACPSAKTDEDKSLVFAKANDRVVPEKVPVPKVSRSTPSPTSSPLDTDGTVCIVPIATTSYITNEEGSAAVAAEEGMKDAEFSAAETPECSKRTVGSLNESDSLPSHILRKQREFLQDQQQEKKHQQQQQHQFSAMPHGEQRDLSASVNSLSTPITTPFDKRTHPSAWLVNEVEEVQ